MAPQSLPPLDSILGAIGSTPVVRLGRLVPQGSAQVHLKLELFNPAGSIKDRICLAMLDAAEAEGRLKPGGTVIEPTSGNTGVGLALVCAVRGYSLLLTMPESASLERRELLKAYGAKLILTPAEQDMEGAMAKAKELLSSTPGAFMPSQFENPANPAVHVQTTARELVETIRADGGRVDAFVVGVGTGGTLTGVGRVLKEQFPGVRLIAVEPEASAVLSGKLPKPHRIQGLGPGFIPAVLDRSLIDDIVTVTDVQAWEMKERLGKEEGLLVGISSGANVWAALKVAAALGEQGRIYTMACDTGERYFSLGEQFA